MMMLFLGFQLLYAMFLISSIINQLYFQSIIINYTYQLLFLYEFLYNTNMVLVENKIKSTPINTAPFVF